MDEPKDANRGFGVLLVEDNPDEEELALRGLAKINLPLIITVARDGQEAVRILSGNVAERALDRAPRLMLLDLRLPKMGGLEVLQFVRANPATASMPVVCMAGSRGIPETAKADGLGVNSFICKPMDFDEYVDVVAKTAEYWLNINFWPT